MVILPLLSGDPPAATAIASRVPLLRLDPTWISVRGPLVSSSKLSSDCIVSISQSCDKIEVPPLLRWYPRGTYISDIYKLPPLLTFHPRLAVNILC